jgi:lysophospholipase L1-like esterase
VVYIYQEIAKKYHCEYLNAAEIVEVGADGVHLDEANNQKLAEKISEKVKETLS